MVRGMGDDWPKSSESLSIEVGAPVIRREAAPHSVAEEQLRRVMKPARLGVPMTEVLTWDHEGGLRTKTFDAYGNRALGRLRR
jgi:hypothetical protein